MNRSLLAPTIGITLLLALSSANVAFADSRSHSIDFLAGSGFLCTLGPGSCPDISMASNGDTVRITGSGIITTHPDSVTGSGTFTHEDSSGNVKASGTWTAAEMISFVSYGSAGPSFPPGFEGGKAVILVHTSVGFDAILTVICALGSPPAGQHEGIHLNVQDVINFNKQVSGFTVFIQTA